MKRYRMISVIVCLAAVGLLTPAAPAEMVLIPAGSFEMGDTFSDGGYNEQPVHTVYLSAYYMDACEVTSAQYVAALNWANAQGG